MIIQTDPQALEWLYYLSEEIRNTLMTLTKMILMAIIYYFFLYDDTEVGTVIFSCSRIEDREEEKEPLPGGSKRRAREDDGEDEKRSTRCFRQDFDFIFNTNPQNQPEVGVEIDRKVNHSHADVVDDVCRIQEEGT